MKRIAKFEKVPYEEFKNEMLKSPIVQKYIDTSVLNERDDDIEQCIRDWYDDIKLPTRATIDSAGYDFFAHCEFSIPAGDESIVIPTGIRCKMEPGYVLSIYPRSNHGFKYRVGLDNTVGIIDGDYYNTPNYGHIKIKLHSGTEKVVVSAGTAFAQGIFTEYFITEDDNVTETRTGGFGSTSK